MLRLQLRGKKFVKDVLGLTAKKLAKRAIVYVCCCSSCCLTAALRRVLTGARCATQHTHTVTQV